MKVTSDILEICFPVCIMSAAMTQIMYECRLPLNNITQGNMRPQIMVRAEKLVPAQSGAV